MFHSMRAAWQAGRKSALPDDKQMYGKGEGARYSKRPGTENAKNSDENYCYSGVGNSMCLNDCRDCEYDGNPVFHHVGT